MTPSEFHLVQMTTLKRCAPDSQLLMSFADRSPLKLEAMQSLQSIQDKLKDFEYKKQMKKRAKLAAMLQKRVKTPEKPEKNLLDEITSKCKDVAQKIIQLKSAHKFERQTPKKSVPHEWSDAEMLKLIDLLQSKRMVKGKAIDAEKIAMELSAVEGYAFNEAEVIGKLSEDFMRWKQRTERQLERYEKLVNHGGQHFLQHL